VSHISPQKPRAAGTFAVIALIVAVVVAGWWWLRQTDDDVASDRPEQTTAEPAPTGRTSESAGADDGGRGDVTDADPDLGTRAEEIAAQDFPDDPRVVVISVDGLGSLWVSHGTTPTLADLLSTGAGTLNARTEVEKTLTLPNHTGMVTGLRVDGAAGGHGVTWNHTSAQSVVPGTESVFSTIDAAGGGSAVFAGKDKFEMWGRAWPGGVDDLVVNPRQGALVSAAIADLRQTDHDLVFLHLAGPDSAGHKYGWGSSSYISAVTQADADIDRVVSAIIRDPELAEEVLVIVTADHGGVPGTTAHSDRRRPEVFRVPFVVWGPGITPGDLYGLNPDYIDPGNQQPGYDGAQPVRNGDVANVVTDLLGLESVSGSEFDADHDLDVD